MDKDMDMDTDMNLDMNIFAVLIVRWHREVISNRKEENCFLLLRPGPVFYLCLRTVLDSKNLISLLAKIFFSVYVLATRS